MPNHFEFNNEGLEDLITGGNNTVSESSLPETVTVETPKDDTLLSSSSEPTEESLINESASSKDNDDFLINFLSEYGIQDGKVTYENEDGETEEMDFNTLDSVEKLNILKELTSPNLTKDEISVINYLRANNATIQDVITYYSQKAVEDYVKEHGPVEKSYAIDEYSDDELYIADLKSKFEDMTEEDLKSDLEMAKENEELFKKKVDIIRKQYKAKEEELANERVKEQERQYNDFKAALETQLTEFNTISMDYKDSKSDSLQIEDSEKEEIYNYILNQDENGATQFFKDLNDPRMLIELAWFALYGKDAISDISNYWKAQLKSTRKLDQKSQTTVVPIDTKFKKDTFKNHRNSVETEYGESLL